MRSKACGCIMISSRTGIFFEQLMLSQEQVQPFQHAVLAVEAAIHGSMQGCTQNALFATLSRTRKDIEAL